MPILNANNITTTTLGIQYQYSTEPTKCGRCGKWFYKGSVSCCVQHGLGQCCHYGDKEAQAPAESKSIKDFLRSIYPF